MYNVRSPTGSDTVKNIFFIAGQRSGQMNDRQNLPLDCSHHGQIHLAQTRLLRLLAIRQCNARFDAVDDGNPAH